MPKLVKCNNPNVQHTYDVEKFPNGCPFCAKLRQQSCGEAPTQPRPQPEDPLPIRGYGSTVSVYSDSNTRPAQDRTQNMNRNSNANLPDDFEDAGKTIGITVGSGTSPVVGWLVAVGGKHKGEDFKLKAGNNFIGRGNDMDVVLNKDNSVSRRKHAIVVYDPKGKVFLVRGGESHELSYLNDEILLETKVLKNYDRLLIGNTPLMFISLVGDKFSWDEN